MRAALGIDLNSNWTVTPSIMAELERTSGVFAFDSTLGDLEVGHFLPEFVKDKWYQAALTVQGKIADLDVLYAGGYMHRFIRAEADYTDYSYWYDKLFGYTATKRHFVPRQAGYEGPVPDSAETLSMDHEQIQFRKAHLATYLKRLVTGAYDGKMVSYLDFVGKMHTPKAGSGELNVPLVQMNALLGFVADALVATIFQLGLDRDTETRTVRAFCKLLWLQNDLINRHYQAAK